MKGYKINDEKDDQLNVCFGPWLGPGYRSVSFRTLESVAIYITKTVSNDGLNKGLSEKGSRYHNATTFIRNVCMPVVHLLKLLHLHIHTNSEWLLKFEIWKFY
jgi:hypothetical protein